MRTLTGGIVLLACLGILAIWFADPIESTDSSAQAVARPQDQRDDLDLRRVQRDTFAAFCDDVTEKVEHRQMNLEQASRRIMTFAQAFYPKYLEHLEPVEAGATLQEKVAFNIVRHFENLFRTVPRRANPALLVSLQHELHGLPCVDAAPAEEPVYDCH